MGVHINISNNLDGVRKFYKKLEKYETPKQYGFAINDTAKDLVKILNKNTKTMFHKPNAFTQKAFGYIRSRSSQKTIAEKSAWVGLKGEKHIVTSEAKPLKQGFTTTKIKKTYKDIFYRLTPEGGKNVRLPEGKQFMYYPSRHSQAKGFQLKNGQLNYRKLNTASANKKKYFSGIPRGGSQSPRFRGLWEREGGNTLKYSSTPSLGKKNPNAPKIKMVASLVSSQTYNKKFYPYTRFVKTNYPRLIRKHYRKQMEFLKRQVKRKKIRQFRRLGRV